MKKYFIFAAIATAGLFASCSSSDDIAANDVQNPIEDSEAREAIRLNLATPTAMVSRGTGTVGGVGTSGDANYIKNVWSGQSINVFMFTKGTSTDAHATTLNLTKNPDYDNTQTTGALSRQYLYNNLEMITPGSAENKIPGMGETANTNQGEAMIEDGTINYYPPAGNFDFFGYHIDGANTATTVTSDGNPPVYYTATDEIPAGKKVGDIKTDATETLWTLPFTINGTQDLMSTKAELSEADVAKMPTTGDRVKDYYSAYSSRRKVHPTLTFHHLLTRLQFSVKAGNDIAAGYEEETAAVNFTDQADVDAYNADPDNVPGALDPSTAYTTYSFTSYPSNDHDHAYATGKAVVIDQNTTYTVIRVINNSVDGFVGNEYEVAATTLTVGSFYNLLLNDGNHTATTIDVQVTEATTNAEEIKAYNASLPGAKHIGDVKTPATGGLTIENAVYVKSINVLSENTKGQLAVAWTADAANMKDYQKITWDAADEQPSSDWPVAENAVPGADTRWLTLKERPYAYKKKTGAAAFKFSDLAAYADKDQDWYDALNENSTPTKATVDDAVATLANNITNAVYQTLSVAGMDKYEVDPDVNVDNEGLQDLTPTAPGIKASETTPANRYPTKRVGEAIILSPGAYEAPANATDNAAVPVATTPSLKMKVKLGQKVPTNWNTPTVRKERTQDVDLEIKAPDGGFKQNTSYNIILTVYGLERIEVIAVVQPWADGSDIGVGADD